MSRQGSLLVDDLLSTTSASESDDASVSGKIPSSSVARPKVMLGDAFADSTRRTSLRANSF